MTEQYIQSTIIKALRQAGGYVVKIVTATEIGVSDILVCLEGRFVSIEVKLDGSKKPTEAQRYQGLKVKKAGGLALLAWNKEMVFERLRKEGFNV